MPTFGNKVETRVEGLRERGDKPTGALRSLGRGGADLQRPGTSLRTRNERKEEQGFCGEKEDGLAEKTEALLFQNGKQHFL